MKLPDKINFKCKMCAVVFGVDESILNVQLIDGFKFVKRSICPKIDNLDKIFQTDIQGLQREYYTAYLANSDDVVCVEKEFSIVSEIQGCNELYNELFNKNLQSLDNQLRIIRLVFEGPIRCKKISFTMDSDSYYLENIESSTSINSIFTVGESFTTKHISTICMSENESKHMNNMIKKIALPIKDNILNSAHIYYDLSYHTEYCISITLLFTALEMLFLKNGDGKKEPLAKRCASYIGENDNEKTQIYNMLITTYKKRSDFVHDGKSASINETDVLFLRECFRKSLLKAMFSADNKSKRINDLKTYISKNQHLFSQAVLNS